MRLYQEALGMYRSAWDARNTANGVAEAIRCSVQASNMILANIFHRKPDMRANLRDQLIQSVVDINLLLERLARDLDYERLRVLRRDLIRCRARDNVLCERFITLDYRIDEGLQILEGYQTEFLRIWNGMSGGLMDHELVGEIQIRAVRRADRGFLLLD